MLYGMPDIDKTQHIYHVSETVAVDIILLTKLTLVEYVACDTF